VGSGSRFRSSRSALEGRHVRVEGSSRVRLGKEAPRASADPLTHGSAQGRGVICLAHRDVRRLEESAAECPRRPPRCADRLGRRSRRTFATRKGPPRSASRHVSGLISADLDIHIDRPGSGLDREQHITRLAVKTRCPQRKRHAIQPFANRNRRDRWVARGHHRQGSLDRLVACEQRSIRQVAHDDGSRSHRGRLALFRGRRSRARHEKHGN